MAEPLFAFRDVVVNGRDARRLTLPRADIAEGGITVVPDGLVQAHRGGEVADNLRTAVELSDDEVASLLASVALDRSFAEREATELSGGEAQRMCLARTLTTRPSVLLADEPTSSLDPEATAHLESLALNLASGGTTVVWVTHDPQQGERLADHHLRLGPT